MRRMKPNAHRQREHTFCNESNHGSEHDDQPGECLTPRVLCLPVLVVIGKLKLQFAIFGANCVRSARGRCFRPRALRTQLAPKIENCELKQVG